MPKIYKQSLKCKTKRRKEASRVCLGAVSFQVCHSTSLHGAAAEEIWKESRLTQICSLEQICTFKI